MTNPRNNSKTFPSVKSPGFTLVEVLLVLFVIVLIMGMAMPSLFGVLRSTQLNSCVDQTRKLIAEARYFAMSTGQTYSLRQADEFVLEIGPAGAELDQNELSSDKTPPVKTYELAEGTRVQDLLQIGADARTPGAGDGAAQVGLAGQATGEPIAYFYPDGTCSSVEITLANEAGRSRVIALRGLTGATIVQDAPSDGSAAQSGANPYTNAGGTP